MGDDGWLIKWSKSFVSPKSQGGWRRGKSERTKIREKDERDELVREMKKRMKF